MDISIKINKKLQMIQGQLIASLWKSPDLYTEYSINKAELSDDGLFYYSLGERMYALKHDVFDEMTVYSTLEGNEQLVEVWKNYGGWQTIKEMMSLVSMKNVDGYFDAFNKYCLLKNLHEKGFNVERDFNKFEAMTTSQVFDFFEYQLNSITIDTVSDLKFESLSLTDTEIDEIMSGANVGLNYGKHSPILNYLTLGLPKGDLTMVASFVNGGKSSYATSNIIIPIAEQGKQVCVISNEQRSIVYKLLLMTYVLTNDLKYYKLTRKKLKTGKWSEEDKVAIEKAREIIDSKYAPYITFIKTYDYDMGKIKKVVKKLAKRGLELLVYDTMKGDDLTNGQVWQGLIEDSKELFQIVSKENISGVVTYQLALSQLQRRFLAMDCLSNAKQVAEVFSEMIFFRDIFSDEFKGQKHDIKPYKFKRDNSTGKLTSIKEEIVLDPNKIYKIFFHVKTRNDSVGTAIVYEFQGHINKWEEIGYARVENTGF